MSKHFHLLKEIDIYGTPYILNFNNHTGLRSTYGGVLTILNFVAIFISFFFLSSELYLKKNPNNIERIITNPLRGNLSFDINIGYIIKTKLGETVKNAFKYYTIIPSLVNTGVISLDNDQFIYNYEVKNLSMTYCLPKNFHPENYPNYKLNDLDEALCINDKELIGGYYDNSYANYISIMLTRCVNSSINNYTCKSNEEIDTWVQDHDQLQLSMFYEQVGYNAMNYTNPLTYYMGMKAILIDEFFCKIDYNFVQEITVSTDSGFILESFTNQTAQRFKDRDLRFFSRDNETKCIVDLNIFKSEHTTINYRTYMKVQDLLGQLLAVFNLIMKFFGSFISTIYSRKMLEMIKSRIFDIKNNDLDENEQKELKFVHKGIPQEAPKINIDDTSVNIIKNLSNRSNLINMNESTFKDDIKLMNVIDKKNGKNVDKDQFEISLWEHFFTVFCPFHKNTLLTKKEKIFKELKKYAIEYTDILNYVSLKCEFEKLKYCIFTKQQLALFDLITLPETPNKKEISKNVTLLYKYNNDEKDKENEILLLMEKLKKENFTLDEMSKKLIEIID